MTQCIASTQIVCTEPAARSSRVASLLAWLKVQARRRRTRKQLAGLPEHRLRDIGLTRHDVRREITRPFWR